MKNRGIYKTGLLATAAIALATTSFSVNSITISDNYIGADAHGWGDVIGASSDFDIMSMDVLLSGSTLTVNIFTNFAGKGDDNLFASYTGGNGIGYGDLFLSGVWTPDGSAPYVTDDASTGTVWEYGFSLDNRWMSEGSAGTGTLYSLNSSNNHSDIKMSDDFLSGATYRNGQEVAVDTTAGDVTAISGGVWSIDAPNNMISFEMDLTGTSLLSSSAIALHWGPTCANDVIEGVAPVPLPAAVWLFMSGIAGLLGVSLRRRK